MPPSFHTTKKNWLLIPLFGTLIFVCLYITATWLYPGGSQAHLHAHGFSWAHNYWCNLLNENAMNGEHNTARPVAIAGMLVLGATLVSFWYIFPVQAGFTKSGRLLMQISGVLAMLTGMFLSTALHDVILNIASFFGLIASAGVFIGLRKLRWRKLFSLGVFNIALVLLNNILYYSNSLFYLPVVQKITFLSFLLWICLIDIGLYKKAITASYNGIEK